MPHGGGVSGGRSGGRSPGRPRGRPSGRPMGVEEFARLPEEGGRTELVRGRVVREPPAGFEHDVVAAALESLLETYVRRRRLGVVAGRTAFVLSRDPPTVRRPDVAFVAAERLDRRALRGRFWPGAPDLAAEVLAPEGEPSAVDERVRDYLAAGVRLVWVVDPRAWTVTVYRPGRPPRVVRTARPARPGAAARPGAPPAPPAAAAPRPRRPAGDELVGEDVVPGFRVPVADLFEGRPRPSTE